VAKNVQKLKCEGAQAVEKDAVMLAAPVTAENVDAVAAAYNKVSCCVCAAARSMVAQGWKAKAWSVGPSLWRAQSLMRRRLRLVARILGLAAKGPIHLAQEFVLRNLVLMD
jgi:hypothetical protein